MRTRERERERERQRRCVSFERVDGPGFEELRALLAEVDLALAGPEARTARLRVERDADHKIVGGIGYETSEDCRHALRALKRHCATSIRRSECGC